jgi:hypothetical protein
MHIYCVLQRNNIVFAVKISAYVRLIKQSLVKRVKSFAARGDVPVHRRLAIQKVIQARVVSQTVKNLSEQPVLFSAQARFFAPRLIFHALLMPFFGGFEIAPTRAFGVKISHRIDVGKRKVMAVGVCFGNF